MAKPTYTPNGFDPGWVELINNALKGRDVEFEITDLSPEMWDNYIGPLLDAIEDMDPELGIQSVIKGDTVACSNCRQQTPASTAHLHQGAWIGEECWDERLRGSE